MINTFLFITGLFVLSWITLIIIGQVIRDVIKDVTTKTLLEINGDNLDELEKVVNKFGGMYKNDR